MKIFTLLSSPKMKLIIAILFIFIIGMGGWRILKKTRSTQPPLITQEDLLAFYGSEERMNKVVGSLRTGIFSYFTEVTENTRESYQWPNPTAHEFSYHVYITLNRPMDQSEANRLLSHLYTIDYYKAGEFPPDIEIYSDRQPIYGIVEADASPEGIFKTLDLDFINYIQHKKSLDYGRMIPN